MVQCVQRKWAGLDAEQLFSSPRVSEQQPFSPSKRSHLVAVHEYFSGGLRIALTIRLFVAAVELAVLFPGLAGATTEAADGEGSALFVDANQRSIWQGQSGKKNGAEKAARGHCLELHAVIELYDGAYHDVDSSTRDGLARKLHKPTSHRR